MPSDHLSPSARISRLRNGPGHSVYDPRRGDLCSTRPFGVPECVAIPAIPAMSPFRIGDSVGRATRDRAGYSTHHHHLTPCFASCSHRNQSPRKREDHLRDAPPAQNPSEALRPAWDRSFDLDTADLLCRRGRRCSTRSRRTFFLVKRRNAWYRVRRYRTRFAIVSVDLEREPRGPSTLVR